MISVVTSTYGRPEMLRRCIRSVEIQTLPAHEHIIVSDGEENDLATVVLGRNWRSFSGGKSFGAIPRLVGSYLASGKYIAYLDDDNEYLPGHLESLADHITATGADFVYSRMKRTDGTVAGSAPPRYCHVDTNVLLHRAELLNTAAWRPSGYNDDWDLVERWLQAGATWSHLPEITVTYHVHD